MNQIPGTFLLADMTKQEEVGLLAEFPVILDSF